MIDKSIHALMMNASILSPEFIEKITLMTEKLIIPSLVIITAVALYTYLAGFGKVAQYADVDEATALLQKTSTSPITDVLTSANNRTALARFKDGHTCLLHTMGHKWVTNTLSGNSLRRVKTTAKGLHLDFRNYTDPHVNITLADDTARAAWITALHAQGT